MYKSLFFCFVGLKDIRLEFAVGVNIPKMDPSFALWGNIYVFNL